MVMVNSPGIHSVTLSLEEVSARIDEIMDMTHGEVAPLVTGHPAMGD